MYNLQKYVMKLEPYSISANLTIVQISQDDGHSKIHGQKGLGSGGKINLNFRANRFGLLLAIWTS